MALEFVFGEERRLLCWANCWNLNLNLMGEGEGEDLSQKKAQSDVAGTGSATSDAPAKKLARQLDFTGFGGSSGSVALPEHPQPQAPAPTQPLSNAQPVTVPQTLAQSPPQSLPLPHPQVVAVPGAPQPPNPSARVV